MSSYTYSTTCIRDRVNYVITRPFQIVKKWTTVPLSLLLEGTKLRAKMWHRVSVTILGDLLDFGKLFKAFGNN